jgi:hypothetical protein
MCQVHRDYFFMSIIGKCPLKIICGLFCIAHLAKYGISLVRPEQMILRRELPVEMIAVLHSISQVSN